MRAILVLLLSGIINCICFAQTAARINDIHNVYDEKGDYYFDRKEFKKAIVYYNMAFQKDGNNYYSVLRKAEAYSALGLLDQATECYQAIFKTTFRIPNEYRLEYALTLLKNKDIKGFEECMGKYNQEVSNETSDKTYLSSAQVRTKMYKDSSFVIVENESVLNTPESEICPEVYKDKLIFASTRKNLDGSTSNPDYNIFAASFLDNGQLGKLNVFNKNLNTTQSESAVAISDISKSLYLTRGVSIKSNLKTYVSTIPAKANDAVDVKDFSIEGFSSIGQLAFNSNATKVYFVSDAPGGIGGLDIYSSDFTGGKWSKPENLGSAINTAKDEMYPFVLNDTVLYFTSAGLNGLGGLDLYSVNLKQPNNSPKNLGNKVNSEFDDYALTFAPGGLTGYFCSNRPGGIGKEDIYRLHMIDLKVKLPAYKFKKKSFIESDKINLYLNDGQEYNIASKDKSGFDFSFQPEEPYKIIVQHENPLAADVLANTKLSADQRQKEFLSPKPLEKTEIRLQPGMKYQFTAGMKPISDQYKADLNQMAGEYKGTGTNAIDLTALAKELMITEGEIYTIQFVKDDNQTGVEKSKAETDLFINDQTVNVAGRSFFILLPLDNQVNFNIQTDIAKFKETFNPKKVGAVKVDETPVIKQAAAKPNEGFPILVNTELFGEAANKIMAKELTIIPGNMYILTLKKTSTDKDKNVEIVVPLTKGVKYNLGAEAQSEAEYNKALAQLSATQEANKNDAELIDISVLSKAIDILPGDSIVFSLMPATQFASQLAGKNVLTTLDVDGRKYFVTSKQKLQVKLKLDEDKKVNIQTDLAYVKENFDASTISLNVDTTSFRSNLKNQKKIVITDPIFDVIVVNFNLNEYTIRPDAKKILDEKVVQTLKGDSRLYVTITGYTDALGDAAHNAKLSQNRAQSVKDYLSANGVGETKIRTFSYGETLALKDGAKWEDLSEEELQKYRKVEIVIYLPKK
jgi:outer membrane protein OmpA-like peptidoglycan-associated protein